MATLPSPTCYITVALLICKSDWHTKQISIRREGKKQYNQMNQQQQKMKQWKKQTNIKLIVDSSW